MSSACRGADFTEVDINLPFITADDSGPKQRSRLNFPVAGGIERKIEIHDAVMEIAARELGPPAAARPVDQHLCFLPYARLVVAERLVPLLRLEAREALLSMCVPTTAERVSPVFLHADPHREDDHMPVPGLVHRYPDRTASAPEWL